MRVSELLAKVEMKPVPQGRMDALGWADGYLVVRYKRSPTLYIFGPAAECERDKLLNPRQRFPDGLFNRLKKKYDWKSMKVETK